MEKFTCKVSSNMNWPSQLTTQNGMNLDFSKPPEYGGLAGTLTPEDAFVASVIMCLNCTFDSYANRMRVKISSFEAEVTGTVDRVDGVSKFSALSIKIRIKVPPETNVETAQKTFDKAKSNCLITASLNVPTEYDIKIEQGS